ncbi:fatty acid-binding protein 9-like [Liolophura sinensis]|uniref:fatty acid-binding protein 9-like n=1 Tax=Liolophura sinensis TaxID=3198878 RepID=UPI003158BAF4
MEGVQKFSGKWKQYQAESLEDFMKEMGMNFMVRKLARTANPEMTIEIADGVMTISTTAGFMSRVNKLKLDAESQMEDEGVLMNYTANMEDGKLITTQEPVDKKRKKVTVYREITDSGDLLQTMCIGDVVCKRWFKRLE